MFVKPTYALRMCFVFVKTQWGLGGVTLYGMFYFWTSQFGEFCIVFSRLHIRNTQKHKHANTATMAATLDFVC